MLVKFRHQSLAIFFHHPSRFVAVLVIFKSVINGKSGHANVNTRFEPVTIWVEPQNRPMFGGSVIQQDYVNVVVKRLFLRRSPPSLFQHELNPMLVMSCPSRLLVAL